MSTIKQNVERLLSEIPNNVLLLAAVKGTSASEVNEAIDAGIRAIGENYLQDAISKFDAVGHSVEWHFIGHIQERKIKKIVEMFDLIETVDSYKLALEIDRQCKIASKKMPIFIEVNSAKEPQKSGVLPEEVKDLVEEISKLGNVDIQGLMTMGPAGKTGEDIRPYFKLTRNLFESINKACSPVVRMKYLSMGMSDSYKVAIEEGANIVRIGTLIFGPREI
ncbi:MAG: YggS family pyridoxal phosphate-dependent enzyme [Caldisericaceae bacterium]